MRFTIHEDILDMFPELRIGLVVGRGLTIKESHEALAVLIERNSADFLERADGKNLSDFNNIKAWRETYNKFGVSPNKFKPTAEALLRRIVNKKPMPVINTAVDAYLAVELVHMLPIGGYDLARISGDIILRKSAGGETFYSIGASQVEYTQPGEIIYADNKQVLTRNWNYRDCDYAKITVDTRDITLACEASLEQILWEDLEGTINKIVENESKFCGGEYTTYFLDKNTRTVNID